MQLVLLALGIVSIPAFAFGAAAVYWNFILLPPFEDRGVQTRAEIVSISEASNEKDYSRTITVEHNPEGSDTRYRHWISGKRANEITKTSMPGVQWEALPTDDADRWVAKPKEVGDWVHIIYLPDEPHSRAVLPLDFKTKHQAPMNRLEYAGLLWVVWLALAGVLWAMGRRRT